MYLPFWFTTKAELFRVSANILSGICSFITLIIAIAFYDKLGKKKKIANNQFEIVEKIFLNINKISFVIDIRIETDHSFNGHSIIYSPHINFKIDKKYDEIPLIFDMNYFQMLQNEIGDFYNPLIPQSIKDRMCKLLPSYIEYKDFNNNYIGKIYFGKSEDKKFGYFNNETITLKEFITNWMEQIIEIKEFINLE